MGFNTVLAVLALGSIVVSAIAVMVLLRGPWFWAWLKGCLGVGGLALAVYFAFLSISLVNYQPLEDDQVVATVSFQMQTQNAFVATVTAHNKQSLSYNLEGDLWQLSVRSLKWGGPLAALSPKQGYQLSVLQSRYLSLEQARSNNISQHDLTPVSLMRDAWRKGSAVAEYTTQEKQHKSPFLPMADGALFQVVWQDGRLVGKPLNGVAEEAMLN